MRTLSIPLLFLVACTGTPATSPADPASEIPKDDPSDDATTDAAATPQAPAEPGLVSEEAFKAAHVLKEGGDYQLQGQMMELPGGSRAYLSMPEGRVGPMPGVVVIHEWWGLNEHIQHWTDRLADEGYAAIAIDLYGGQVATSSDEAMALMKAVDQEAALQIVREGHNYLQGEPAIQAPKTGSIGWCFGGGWSLQLAQNESDLDAAVIYYGRLTDDPEALKEISAPVLGHFGANDTGIPKEAVQGFHDAMKELGKPVTVHMYDADHAFANPSGGRYDAEDAEKAWAETRRFLGHHLK